MRTVEQFENAFCPEPNTGCWLWTLLADKDDYGMLRWQERPGRKAHRVAWTIWRGPIPAGMCVLHKCDTPPCCNPDHLFLGTPTSNMADKVAKGRQAKGPGAGTKSPCRGAANVNAKLTDAAVVKIRAMYASGAANQYELARAFGVGQPVIGKVVRRESWRHVP